MRVQQDYDRPARRDDEPMRRVRRAARTPINRAHVAQVALCALALVVLSRLPLAPLFFDNVPGGRGDQTPFVGISERMVRPPYAICEYHQQVDCVVDATTFWRSGVKYRVAGIDPPDPFSAECNHERDMSRTAMWSLVSALNDRGPVRIAVKGAALPGNLGRPVDVTLKDGTALADVLVAQKAARRGDRANPWCDVLDDPTGRGSGRPVRRGALPVAP